MVCRVRCWANQPGFEGNRRPTFFLLGLLMHLPPIRCRPQRLPIFVHSCRQYATTTPFPRVVGAGEAKTSTPIAPPTLPWYRQPSFLRKCVNILLLSSFVNTMAIILSYKSMERELAWQSKERIRTLRETIEKVRKGEQIDIRAALGTGNPEAEKKWDDGTELLSILRANAQIVLREIEEQERTWQEKTDLRSARSSPTTDDENLSGK